MISSGRIGPSAYRYAGTVCELLLQAIEARTGLRRDDKIRLTRERLAEKERGIVRTVGGQFVERVDDDDHGTPVLRSAAKRLLESVHQLFDRAQSSMFLLCPGLELGEQRGKNQAGIGAAPGAADEMVRPTPLDDELRCDRRLAESGSGLNDEEPARFRLYELVDGREDVFASDHRASLFLDELLLLWEETNI